MKKIFLLPLLFLLTSCFTYYRYEIEVTYFNGEKEIVSASSHSGFSLHKGDLISSNMVVVSNVRNFRLIKKVKED